MHTVKPITDILYNYGWPGLSAILMVTIFVLARYVKKQSEDRLADSQGHNDRMFEMLEKKVETDLKHQQAFRELTKVVEKLISKI